MTLCDPPNDFGCPHNDSLSPSQWLYDLYTDSLWPWQWLCVIQAMTYALTTRLCNHHKILCDLHNDLCVLKNAMGPHNDFTMTLCSIPMSPYDLNIDFESSQSLVCPHVCVPSQSMWPSQWHYISSQWLLSPCNDYICQNNFVLIINIWSLLWICMTLCTFTINLSLLQ